MARHQKKNIFKYFLPFIILLLLLGSGFLGFKYYFQSHTAIVIEEIKPVATLTIEKGKVDIKLVDTQTWNRANDGMTLFTGDSIKTLPNSFISIEFFDKSVVRLDGSSELLITNLQKDETVDIVDLDLKTGRLWARVMKILDEHSRFEITTPTAQASVKGTAFELVVERRIVVNPETGEEEEIITTNIKVIESEVGFRAISKTTTEDPAGNLKTETKILASVVLPEGSQSSIDENDIDQFGEEAGGKPIVRGLSPSDRESEWLELNAQLDLLHLQSVQGDLQIILADLEAQGFFDKLLRSNTESEREDATREIFEQVQRQLSELASGSSDDSGNQNQNSQDDENKDNEERDQDKEQNQNRQHIVQTGDTLSAIASRYGTTVSALMSANGITDPSLLAIGQELIIPSGSGGSGSGGAPVVSPGGHTSNNPPTTQNQEQEEEQEQNQNQNGKQEDTNVQDDEPFISAQ